MCTEVRDNCTEEITEALIAIGQESVLSLVIPDCDGRNPPSANESDPSPTALQPKFPSADYDWQANWTFVVSGFVIPWNVTCSVTGPPCFSLFSLSLCIALLSTTAADCAL
jgi:hypothetical protein